MRYARIYPWRRTRRSRAPSNGSEAFFVAQFSAGYTTNMFGFDLRQGQGHGRKTRGARSKTKSRILHGKEGKGRFKALALGRVVDWNIHYRENGILLGYTVTIIREDLVDVRVSEPKAVDPA